MSNRSSLVFRMETLQKTAAMHEVSFKACTGSALPLECIWNWCFVHVDVDNPLRWQDLLFDVVAPVPECSRLARPGECNETYWR